MSITLSAVDSAVPSWLKTIGKVTLLMVVIQLGSTVYKTTKNALSLDK